ncbi:hypothetical protein PsYK624_070220 [Phanerochaete sordida]|uniref:Clathrin/coatomer adaptor adaptin-like N-terminal domain-containing protein n=1 Tax=Phanerochaete sordida TaxID=48140 RepID=A0A9P3G9N8_9APHY|nr:hypothetical protein PsYK624_070220 [Phanerochaete sordida]
MDIPFISSGALSRAHYALVRKVEIAASPSEADQHLLAEVEHVRDRLTRSASSARQVKECLVILLYCSMNSMGPLPDVEFALPHALNLAEAGHTVQDKRIGYLYCAEMMPKSHELQLMLVNTLRKDLESPDIAHICLALDVLIQVPSEDVIPAVRERLQDLLSHNSSHIRRRVLLAFRSLGVYENSILQDVVKKMRQRLEDPDPAVACAALAVSIKLLEAGIMSADRFRPILLKRLKEAWKVYQDGGLHLLLLSVLQVLRVVRPCFKSLLLISEILTGCVRLTHANAVIYQCFQVLACSDAHALLEAQESAGVPFVGRIRHLLVSEDVNDVYLFVSCLDYLEASLWAGTNPDTASVLEAWEVERVMQLLDSQDSTLRRKTLSVLRKVDYNIVESFYGQLLQASSSLSGPPEQEEAVSRLLEVISLLYADSGESYAQHLQKIVEVVETAVIDVKPHVLQTAVEDVLTKFRLASAEFRSGAIGVLAASLQLADDGKTLGPTMTVILPAVLCEYLDLSPLSPVEAMKRLSSLLPTHSASIQDVILLALLRIASGAEQIPDSVLGIVGKIREQGGRHIKRRCDQFIRISQSTAALHTILSQAKSYSLPDILVALESYEASPDAHATGSSRAEGTTSPDRPSSRASSRASHTAGKLRYKAYDAPRATPRLRAHPGSPALSAHSDSGSSRFVGQDADDALARTITAGDLALAGGQIELQELGKSAVETSPSLTSAMQALSMKKDEKLLPVPETDLIALESPFISDPPAVSQSQASSVAEEDFEAAWDRLQHGNLRGWCDSPIDVVVRRLQSLQRKMRVTPADEAPFQGDLKIFIPSEDASSARKEGLATLRLREGEEESCLWHLRCEDGDLRASIRTLLTDA